jgi:Spy/CpxP family protein refolding chaperone
MRRTKWLWLAGALAAVALLGAGCLGRHPGRDPQAMKRFVAARVDDLLDDVDATDAQRTQIGAIEERLFAEGAKLGADHDAVRTEALRQLTADAPDAARLHALVDGRVDAFRAFAHQAVDGMLEARAVLTPEQRAKLDNKLRRHLEE